MSDIDEQFSAAVKMQSAGELLRAEMLYRRILQQQTEYLPAQRKLGIALHKQGKVAEATGVYRDYLQRQPGDSSIHGNLGLALRDQGMLDDAISSLQRALELNPGNADACNTLGATYQTLGRLKEAECFYRRAIELQDSATHHSNLGQALLLQGDFEGAASSFRQAVDIEPADASLWENLGQACTGLRDISGAIESYQRALRLNPERSSAAALLADLFERSHANEEAAALAREALRLDASQPWAHLVLSRLDRRNGKLEAARLRLEQQLRHRHGQGLNEGTTSIRFELGLVLDRLREYESAYQHVCEGKAAQMLQLAGRVPSHAIVLRQIVRLHQWVTPQRVAGWSEDAGETTVPLVFFVGFPRSGTTLAEQILASHGTVVTTDEQLLLRTVKKRSVELLGPGARYPGSLDLLSDDQIGSLRRLYFDLAEQATGDSLTGKCLVDKLPLNLIELALVRRLFPQAKVIVALRDPRDVCVSCFLHHFQINEATVHFCDMSSTARLYAAVMNLWLHFRKTLGLSHLEYRYEDLVDDTEGIARQILAFIGLAWDPQVLDYMHTASRKTISTPSYQDVTQPIYRRAVSRWKNYRGQLMPILGVLEPFVREFTYPAGSQST